MFYNGLCMTRIPKGMCYTPCYAFAFLLFVYFAYFRLLLLRSSTTLKLLKKSNPIIPSVPPNINVICNNFGRFPYFTLNLKFSKIVGISKQSVSNLPTPHTTIFSSGAPTYSIEWPVSGVMRSDSFDHSSSVWVPSPTPAAALHIKIDRTSRMGGTQGAAVSRKRFRLSGQYSYGLARTHVEKL